MVERIMLLPAFLLSSAKDYDPNEDKICFCESVASFLGFLVHIVQCKDR